MPTARHKTNLKETSLERDQLDELYLELLFISPLDLKAALSACEVYKLLNSGI